MDYETLEKILALVDEYTRNANAYCSHMRYVVEVQERDNPNGHAIRGADIARADAMIAFKATQKAHDQIHNLVHE